MSHYRTDDDAYIWPLVSMKVWADILRWLCRLTRRYEGVL